MIPTERIETYTSKNFFVGCYKRALYENVRGDQFRSGYTGEGDLGPPAVLGTSSSTSKSDESVNFQNFFVSCYKRALYENVRGDQFRSGYTGEGDLGPPAVLGTSSSTSRSDESVNFQNFFVSCYKRALYENVRGDHFRSNYTGEGDLGPPAVFGTSSSTEGRLNELTLLAADPARVRDLRLDRDTVLSTPW